MYSTRTSRANSIKLADAVDDQAVESRVGKREDQADLLLRRLHEFNRVCEDPEERRGHFEI